MVAAVVMHFDGQILFDHFNISQILFDGMPGPSSNEVDAKQAFAKALGDAIREFLKHEGIQKADVAEDFGVASKQLFHYYLNDRKNGPPAYVFYLACTRLGFKFDYEGYRISARPIKREQAAKPSGQYTLNFDRTFELTDRAGTLKVTVKRPPERLELSVSVDANAS